MTAVAEHAPARRADPGRIIGQAVTDTEVRLAYARKTGDVKIAADARAAAEETHVRAVTARYPLGLQLRASAAIRLAERTLALVIRAGQHAGTIRRQGDSTGRLPSPNDLAGVADLGRFYALADGITDAEFGEALAACMAREDTSRAHLQRVLANAAAPSEDWIPAAVDRTPEAHARRRELITVRAAAGMSSPQIGKAIAMSAENVRKVAAEIGVRIPADDVTKRTRRRVDSSRITEDGLASLAGLIEAFELVNPDDLDPAQTQNWADSLTASIRALNRFKQLIAKE